MIFTTWNFVKNRARGKKKTGSLIDMLQDWQLVGLEVLIYFQKCLVGLQNGRQIFAGYQVANLHGKCVRTQKRGVNVIFAKSPGSNPETRGHIDMNRQESSPWNNYLLLSFLLTAYKQPTSDHDLRKGKERQTDRQTDRKGKEAIRGKKEKQTKRIRCYIAS